MNKLTNKQLLEKLTPIELTDAELKFLKDYHDQVRLFESAGIIANIDPIMTPDVISVFKKVNKTVESLGLKENSTLYGNLLAWFYELYLEQNKL